MREKGIRQDIIESSTSSNNLDNILKTFKKTSTFNKFITKKLGAEVISSYKRAFNILNSETQLQNEDYKGSADPALFKSNFALVDNSNFLSPKEPRQKFGGLVKGHINKWVNTPIKNPIGKKWVEDQLKLRKAGVK